MAVEIEVADITPFAPSASEAVIQQLIDGTIARAARIAPCLKSDDLDEDSAVAAKDILIGVIARATEVGTGEVTTISAGPASQTIDTTARRTTRFRPDEIRELQSLCGISRGGAFTITLMHDDADVGIETVLDA